MSSQPTCVRKYRAPHAAHTTSQFAGPAYIGVTLD